MVTNMVMENSFGLMAVDTEVISKTTIYVDMAHIHGKMVELSLVNGRTIKCMEKGSLNGRMVENM